MPDHLDVNALTADELRASIAELRRLRSEHMGNAETALGGRGADVVAALFLRNAAAYSERIGALRTRLAELEAEQ